MKTIKTNEAGEVEEHVLALHLGLKVAALRAMREPGGWRKETRGTSRGIFWNALGLGELEKKIGAAEKGPSAPSNGAALIEVAVETPEEAACLGFDALPPEKKSGTGPLVTIVRGKGVIRRVVNPRWAVVAVEGVEGRCRFPTTAGLRPGMGFENVAWSPSGAFWVFTGAVRPFPGRVLKSF